MAGFGEFALYLAVASAVWGLLASLQSVRGGRPELGRSAQGALLAVALCLTAASAALLVLLLRHDFSVVYVVEYTSRSMPTIYTIGAFWAGQQGSLLLWAWLASIAGFLVVRSFRRTDRLPLMASGYAVAALAGVVTLFSAVVAFTANPFDRMPVAMPDGQGLNLLLQNYGQLIHPVALYLGMVGLGIPFAYAVAGLAAGLDDNAWLIPARRWTMWSWIFLTAGIALGMQWSYVELGWGGYWAWDPVENASLLPWLTATAFLHSAPLQQYRGMFRVWNPTLVFITFALSLLGTFLTRSGVVSSVHAFASSPVGPFLLAGVLMTVFVGGALLVWRLPALRGGARLGETWSADGAVVLGNLLLAAMAAVVLWGTLFPLTSKAFRGVESSVGPGFYQTLVVPMALVLLVALGAYPVLRRWRRTGGIPGELVRAGVAALATAVLVGLLDRGRHFAMIAVLAVAVATMVTVAEPYARAAWATWARRGVAPSVGGVTQVSRRRVGATIAHLGLVMFLAAVAVHVSTRQYLQSTLQIGQTAHVGAYTLRLDSLTTESRTGMQATVATVSVTDSTGRALGTVKAEQQFSSTQQQPVAEVGVRSTVAEDLYLALEGADPAAGSATLGSYVNPGMLWIWIGCLTIVVGATVAAWPSRMVRRRPLRTLMVARRLTGVGARNDSAEV